MALSSVRNRIIPGLRSRFSDPVFCRRLLFVLLILLFAERVAGMLVLGPCYNLANDDMGYVNSGFTFARTGVISIYSQYPSAMIMPGLPVLCGALSLLTGEGELFFIAIKLLFFLFGILTALAAYMSVKLFAPERFALLAVLPFFLPNAVWMNNLVLTETPYCCFLAWSVFFTLSMGREITLRNSAAYALTFFCALMFRNVALLIPAGTFAYLFIIRRRELRRVLAALAGVVLLLAFFSPWAIRNYRCFGAFIPFTYGAGSPTLQGTYQGRGWPEDSVPDYETNVDAVFRDRFSDYLDDNGEPIDPAQAQYLSLSREMIQAKYRMSVWFENSPLKFLISYLVIKPLAMTVEVFYWKELFGCPLQLLTALRYIGDFLAAAAVILCLVRKKHSAPILYLAGFYVFCLLITSISLACDRYGEVLMVLRYVIVALGFDALR